MSSLFIASSKTTVYVSDISHDISGTNGSAFHKLTGGTVTYKCGRDFSDRALDSE